MQWDVNVLPDVYTGIHKLWHGNTFNMQMLKILIYNNFGIKCIGFFLRGFYLTENKSNFSCSSSFVTQTNIILCLHL